MSVENHDENEAAAAREREQNQINAALLQEADAAGDEASEVAQMLAEMYEQKSVSAGSSPPRSDTEEEHAMSVDDDADGKPEPAVAADIDNLAAGSRRGPDSSDDDEDLLLDELVPPKQYFSADEFAANPKVATPLPKKRGSPRKAGVAAAKAAAACDDNSNEDSEEEEYEPGKDGGKDDDTEEEDEGEEDEDEEDEEEASVSVRYMGRFAG